MPTNATSLLNPQHMLWRDAALRGPCGDGLLPQAEDFGEGDLPSCVAYGFVDRVCLEISRGGLAFLHTDHITSAVGNMEAYSEIFTNKCPSRMGL